APGPVEDVVPQAVQQPVERAERRALDDGEGLGELAGVAALAGGGVDVAPQLHALPVIGTGLRQPLQVTLREQEAVEENVGRGRPTLQPDQIETEDGRAHQAVHGNQSATGHKTSLSAEQTPFVTERHDY